MTSFLKQGVGFVFFKSIVFFSVVFYSYAGFPSEYIRIEKSIAWASMLLPFMVLGLTTSYSHYNLVLRDPSLNWVYWFHMKVAFVLLSLVVLPLVIIFSDYYLVAMLLALFVASRFISQYYKTKSRVVYASLFDSLPYVFLFVCFSLMFAWRNFDVVSRVLFCGLFLMSVLAQSKAGVEVFRCANTQGVRGFYSFGFTASLVSAVVVVAVMVPRALADELVGAQGVEGFLLSLRYCSLLILVYQFISLKWFSRIYQLKLETVFWVFIILLLGFFLAAKAGLLSLYRLGIISVDEHSYFVSVLISFWVVSAFLEYFVCREHGVNIFLYAVVFSCLLICGVGWVGLSEFPVFMCLLFIGSVLCSQLASIFRFSKFYLIVGTTTVFIPVFGVGLLYV